MGAPKTYCLFCVPLDKVENMLYALRGTRNSIVSIEKHPECGRKNDEIIKGTS